MDNLEEVITESIEDAELPVEPVETEPVEVDSTTTPAEISSPEVTEEPVEASSTTSPAEVTSPAAQPVAKPADEFEKKFGIAAQSSSGRENRIPYSRVKKITEKAVADAKKEWETQSSPKLQEYEAKLKEYEPKLQDYETRLSTVAEFERLMVEDKPSFLKLLTRIPGYSEIFESLGQQAASQSQAPAQPDLEVSDDMPMPDQPLADGSMVYSMEGLKALMAWNTKQAETKITKQFEQRFGPIEQDYRQYQRVQAVKPHVDRQIAEARTWPLFNESEEAIVKALQQNPQWGLERAYQHVVLPKLQAEKNQVAEQSKLDRNKMRAEILAELKQRPTSTAAPAGSARPSPVSTQAGPRSLEDVIAQAVKGVRQ